jgi:hypothetical protein
VPKLAAVAEAVINPYSRCVTVKALNTVQGKAAIDQDWYFNYDTTRKMTAFRVADIQSLQTIQFDRSVKLDRTNVE